VGSTRTDPFGAAAQPAWLTPAAGAALSAEASSQFGRRIDGLADKLSGALNDGNTGGAPTDGALAAKLSLLGQYAAMNFATSADLSSGAFLREALSPMQTPTLARSQPGTASHRQASS
jgi:hypothetical protein